MLVRVATDDLEGAKLLLVDLVGRFGAEHVSLQVGGEVQLRLRGEVNGALVQTLEAVQRWLDRTGTASAQVCVDEHSYTIEHPQRFLGSNGSSTRPTRLKAVGRR